MIEQVEYKIMMSARSPWMIGYHIELDELFLYFVDQDDVCYVFRKGGMDSIWFCEYMNFDSALLLGQL